MLSRRLFILGNGFDLAHDLPTKYDPHFKSFTAHDTIKNESYWELYGNADIWADFENNLGTPDFNNLSEMFEGLYPDYSSDYERDRTSIIFEPSLHGDLYGALSAFAENADNALVHALPKSKLMTYFNKNDLFLSFNYTHTLEHLYNIDDKQIFHIHGLNKKTNLIIGYPEGNFKPQKLLIDSTMKGRHYIEVDVEDYIKGDEENYDYYINTAWQELYNRCKSLYKVPQIKELRIFLEYTNISEIIVIGHSYKIDFSCFVELNEMFEYAVWKLYYKSCIDLENAKKLATKINICDRVEYIDTDKVFLIKYRHEV